MAFASKLSETKFDNIYDSIKELAEKALTNHTNAEFEKKGSVKPGFFPNPWTKVLNLWTRDKLSNIEVYDMIKTKQVTVIIETTPYDETLR